MAGMVNKRQQVRNERALQELIRTVPGNDKCAECGARNPGWASWSLGIFLCIRCAALHRKLGTHLSKVKSLSMDSWTTEQVDNMKRVGNAANNKLYNPKGVHPSIPVDIDEVDGAMERFIRQKYEHRVYQGGSHGSNATSPGSRHNTGSTSSEDRAAPVLPPKPNKRFFFPSLRSASSTVPRQGTLSPPTSPGYNAYGEPSPPPKENKKHSKFLGASVANTRDDAFERKIQYLKDMGFLDEKKNAQVLKGLNGNVDKAVETLIRLGEGTSHNKEAREDQIRAENARNALPTPRATPVNGITVEKNRMSSLPPQPNNNPFPFDKPADTNKSLPPPPSSGTTSPTNRSISPPQAYNPFAQQIAPAQQQPSIDQAFSNMSLNQQPTGQMPQQQLFPNTTGGYGNQNQASFNPFMQQTAPPPVPQIPQQYSQFTPPTSTNLAQQAFPPQPQPSYPDPTPNPFLRTSRSQNFNPSNPFDTQGPFNAYSTAPQAQPPTQSYSVFGIQPQPTGMPQQSYAMQPQPTGFQSQSNTYNPFQASNPPSQSVFGSGMTASPAGTPFGQQVGQQIGNSYFGQQNAGSSSNAQQSSSPFGQQQAAASSPFGQPIGASPFMPQPTGMGSSPFAQPNGTSSPFGQPNGSSPFGQARPVQQQPGYQQSPPDMQHFQAPQAPFAQSQQSSFLSPSSAPPQQQSMFQPPQQQPQQPQQLVSQPTGMQFHDKTSILSLYNMPHLAPQRPMDLSQQQNGMGGQTVVQDFATQQPAHNVPQRSVTMPVSSMQMQNQAASPPNPFASLAGMTKPPNAMQNSSAFATISAGGPSRESVDFAGLAMMNGRHSPDAFSGLSARMR